MRKLLIIMLICFVGGSLYAQELTIEGAEAELFQLATGNSAQLTVANIKSIVDRSHVDDADRVFDESGDIDEVPLIDDLLDEALGHERLYIIHLVADAENVEVLKYLLENGASPRSRRSVGDGQESAYDIINRSDNQQMKDALINYNNHGAEATFKTAVRDVILKKRDSDIRELKYLFATDPIRGRALDEVMYGQHILRDIVYGKTLSPNDDTVRYAYSVMAICAPYYSDKKQGLHDFLNAVINQCPQADAAGWNAFKQKNEAHFGQNNFGKLDYLRDGFVPEPGKSWAVELWEKYHEAQDGAYKNLLKQILTDLDDYRSYPIENMDALDWQLPAEYQGNVKAWVKDFLFDVCFEVCEDDEIYTFRALTRQGKIQEADIVEGWNSLLHEFDRCKSTLLFRNLNNTRDEVNRLTRLNSPELPNFRDVASDDQKEFVITLLGDCLDGHDFPLKKYLPTILKNAFHYAAEGIAVDPYLIRKDPINLASIGKKIDEKVDAPGADVFWKNLQTACRQVSVRGVNNWVSPDTDPDGNQFVGLALNYIATGDEYTHWNIQNYVLDRDLNHNPLTFKVHFGGQQNDMDLEEFLDRILISAQDDYYERNKSVDKFMHNGINPRLDRNDYQAGKSDDVYGKEVTGKLLAATIEDVRMGPLAKEYYAKYPINIDTIDVPGKNSKLNEFVRKNPNHDGVKAIKKIPNLRGDYKKKLFDYKDPVKSSWSTTNKLIATMVVLGIGYMVYSSYTDVEDDANTSAA